MEKVRVVRIRWSEVAEESGISQRAVYNWRKDRRNSTVTTDEAIKAALFKLYRVMIQDIQDQLG